MESAPRPLRAPNLAAMAQPSPIPAEVAELQDRVRAQRLPRHVGVIMDGNGRWAEQRGLPRLAGHREGSESVRAITRTARRIGLSALTLYAFSSQNWSRPADEIAGLMDLLREYLVKERDELMDNGIRLNAMGDRGRLPRIVRAPLDALREETAPNRQMTLTLALSYGGREELVRGARLLAEQVAAGKLSPAAIDAAALESTFWSAGLPELDLVVRTSGEKRISNFLLYQAAYAELYFTDALWPDFRERAFLDAILAYQVRERRFGLTSAQLGPANASDL
jgi:undecaprenyl diphosphate synthase